MITWVQEFVVRDCALVWVEGIHIDDPIFFEVVKEDVGMQALVYTCCQMGVKIGVA